MLKLILIFLAGVGIGGTVGIFAMSLAAASKVEPPPLIKDKNVMKQHNVENQSEDDEE